MAPKNKDTVMILKRHLTLILIAFSAIHLAITCGNTFSGEPVLRQLGEDQAVFMVGEDKCEILLELKNKGEKAMQFDKVVISCGCVESGIQPSHLAPGDVKQFRLRVKSDKSGQQGASVELWQSGDKMPVAYCQVKFFVQGPFETTLVPSEMKDLDPLQDAKFKIQVTDANGSVIGKSDIRADSLSDRIKVDSIENGIIFGRVLSVPDRSISDGYILIRVPRLSSNFELRHQIRWEYKKSGYEVSPRRVYLGPLDTNVPKDVSIQVSSFVEDTTFEIAKVSLGSGLELMKWTAERKISEGIPKIVLSLKIKATRPPSLGGKYYNASLGLEIARDDGKTSQMSVPVSAIYRTSAP